MRKQVERGRTVEPSPFILTVVVHQPQHDCVLYSWDHAHACLRVTGLYHADAGLPADLAIMKLEELLDVPVLVLSAHSFPPGTRLDVRVLGAIRACSAHEERKASFALDGWFLIAVATIDAATYSSLEHLPPAQQIALQSYILTDGAKEGQPFLEEQEDVQRCDADEVARLLRETRVQIKRGKRTQRRSKEWYTPQGEAVSPSWRIIEGLSDALRAQLQQDHLVQGDAPHAQAEHLIRFVPQRFQEALAELLLDDERLLAFVERPLLRHRTGVLKMQQWRSNAGLFLVTDRQVLWLRDFLSPGKTFLSGGYIAHSAPVERLQQITLLPAGAAPVELAAYLDSRDSPYLRLVMQVQSRTGSEHLVIEFPQHAETEKMLARVVDLLQAFLPRAKGSSDRRVRCLPVVDIWQPQGAVAERLRGLGGSVPATLAQQFERRLAEEVSMAHDACLASALVPALEDYQSPARLVALTRHAVLVFEEEITGKRLPGGNRVDQAIRLRWYDLTTLTSAQLRSSLLGSSLSLFLPQVNKKTEQVVLPFQSPAIAWFRPLFTRLRVALSGPFDQQQEQIHV
jgi:hypothetical protein